MLGKADVSVLEALSEDPLASFDTLGKTSGLSQSAALKRVKKLVANGFLGKEFVRAQINYAAVGLETVIVFVEAGPASWKELEAACDAHPYTQFRIRVMGATNGFMLTFSIPLNGRSLLLEFLDGLRARGIISSFSVHLPVSYAGHSETRFSLFDPITNKWNFNWEAWEAEIEGAPSTRSLMSTSVLHELDQTDIAILRALSMDSRAEKKGVAEKIGIKDYEMSKRLRFIEESKLVSFYRIVHETGILGIAMTVVLKCKASLEYSGRVLNAAAKLPFQGIVYPLEDGFVILANMPPGEVTSLATLMQKHCESISLMWGDYSSSMKYFFDNEPSNFGAKGWITDRQYVVEAPLKSLSQTMQDQGAANPSVRVHA